MTLLGPGRCTTRSVTAGCVGARGRCLVVAFLLGACDDEPQPAPAHPAGWLDEDSPEFHGAWLRANGDPLDDCERCHTAYDGCDAFSCHTEPRGPEWCGTCHGGEDDPRPATGAHAKHEALCATCHPVPDTVTSAPHLDGAADVAFTGLALPGAWDATSGRCAGTYCHGASSPDWNGLEDLGCDGCHAAPPASHDRFARVAAEDSACADCHPAPPDARHLDGVFDLAVADCGACHGAGPDGLPPPALDGATEPTARGVGAHVRHGDATLSDRIGRAVHCATCHVVPTNPLDEGHLDEEAPADVTLVGWDAATSSCVVACHFDRAPGPSWTDASGAARACDACHAFPPLVTRAGGAHFPSEPTLAACQGCHLYEPAEHVDGDVDYVP